MTKPHQVCQRLKLRLCVTAVVSVMTYDCESWFLTPKVMRKLNGANSMMLARIIGTSMRDEARSVTARFDLVKDVRARRLLVKWAAGVYVDEYMKAGCYTRQSKRS